MSDGVIASAQGLLDASSTGAVAFLVLLSLLLSRILFGSPLEARLLVSPEELDPEVDSAATVLDVTLDVSICRDPSGDLDLEGPAFGTAKSSSTQPAGVGGTGPKFDTGPSLRVGGDCNRSVDRDILCDLDDGGGPGGGGGKGMPGSHLVVEDPRDLEEDGVLIAPADTALRDAGGRDSYCDPSSSEDGTSTEIGTRGCLKGPWSLSSGGAGLGGSGAGLLAKDDILNMEEVCRSCEAALIRELGGGGGGKTGFEDGSGEDLY